jgi:GR25 family glycosyltransferase involved in LPS biosynthesis
MSNCFDFFEQIYCINLKSRSDRWENCISQFSDLGISERVERREGILCGHPALSKKQNAQIGCALSHYNILKEAQKNSYSNVLVFEDDFLFLKDKRSVAVDINKSINELPEDWDIFYFSGFFVKGYDYAAAEKYSENLIRAKTCFCTHAMAYSKKGINKILKNIKLETEFDILNFSKEYEAIDWYYVKEVQDNSECFSPKNLLCIQKAGHSDIENKYFDYRGNFQESYKQHVEKFL